MTIPRQREDDGQAWSVRTLSLVFRDGFRVNAHRHDWAQLVWGSSGMLRVVGEGRIWLVPPTRAIWIPADTEHQFLIKGQVAFRTLYVAPSRAHLVERGLSTFEVSPFMSELILHIFSREMLAADVPSHDRLAGLLVDLTKDARDIDLMLPLPQDPRARRLADHFQSRPADNSDLPGLAPMTGASIRTLQRCFVLETGLTVDAWRQKARLIASTAALSAGSSVTGAALDCGYESPSAFIAAFKQQFSMTPKFFAKSAARL